MAKVKCIGLLSWIAYWDQSAREEGLKIMGYCRDGAVGLVRSFLPANAGPGCRFVFAEGRSGPAAGSGWCGSYASRLCEYDPDSSAGSGAELRTGEADYGEQVFGEPGCGA